LTFDRRYPAKVMRTFEELLTNPLTSARVGVDCSVRLANGNLWAARGRANKLSFVVHNFMDACGLEKELIEACAFMVMTRHGPMSMCLHNAKRDAFIFEPIPLLGSNGRFWNQHQGAKPIDWNKWRARTSSTADWLRQEPNAICQMVDDELLRKKLAALSLLRDQIDLTMYGKDVTDFTTAG
jgi:hypothetical protein